MKLIHISLAVFTVFLFTKCSMEKIESSDLRYPNTKKVDVADTYFGVTIPDPYRWLEDDMSDETAEWVKEQNGVTFGYLDHIPFRNKVKQRLEQLWNYPKYSAPFKAGGKYFFSKNDGLQNQSVLYMMRDLQSEPEVLLDPNLWSSEGTVSLGTLDVSQDGKYLAYTFSQAGSDWQNMVVMDLGKKESLTDTLKWIKFGGAAWHKDGFYYSRYDQPEGSDLSAKNEFHKVYYHKLGDNQERDQLIFEDKTAPLRYHFSSVTDDQRFLILYIAQGTSGLSLKIKDLTRPESDFVTIVDNFENNHRVVDNIGEDILLLTNRKAPNQRIVKFKLTAPSEWLDVIPESKNRVSGASIIGKKIFVEYLVDAASKVMRFDLNGKNPDEMKLPGIGSVSGINASPKDREFFYMFTSFTMPPSIYKYSMDENKSTIYQKPELDFNADAYETKQVFYESKDGTKIPMFIVHKKGIVLDGNNATYLYAYGGFDVSLTPVFSTSTLVWLENGGIFAQPSLRGGGEYGEQWHKAGMLLNKQNVFDDFTAAAEYLIHEKYTSSDKLAIAGGSNGGLLVGATMTQRPDLAKVAFPAVGVMDMLRYESFTVGWGWAVEYGSVKDSVHFKNLLSYSPLHNLKEGTAYPATLITTADHDDRVVPAHSFKFAAALQEKHRGDNPVLIRVETQAGHGAGKPTSKIIEEQADKWSFAWYNMGVLPPIAKDDM